MNNSTYDIAAEENTLREAADAYYNGAPIMSDPEFDRRFRNHKKIRIAYPEEFPTDTILDRVGAPVSANLTQRRHQHPMLSLDNVFEAEDDTSEDLRTWLVGMSDHLVCVEPKLDGLALSIVYLGGLLSRAVTRGDGAVGEDVTAHVIASGMVPMTLKDDPTKPWSGAGTYTTESVGDYFEVRGEVVMSWEQFHKLQDAKKAAGESLAANPRNAAAGAMALKDPEECARRGLHFVAHGSVGDQLATTHGECIWALRNLGFAVIRSVPASALAWIGMPVSSIKSLVMGEDMPYPVDGLVFKLDALDVREQMGCTSRAPRWATALKFQQEKVVTKLKAITVQVGRSGVLTPVAELEPVWVDGSTVSRATLHNEDQINRLGLQVGDDVEVRKAGAIIPEIVSSVTRENRREALYDFFAAKHPDDTLSFRTGLVKSVLSQERPPFNLVRHIGGKCPSCGGTDIRKPSAGTPQPAEDPYTATAAHVFQVDATAVTPEQRSLAKSLTHAKHWHATPETLRRIMEGSYEPMTPEKASEMLARLRERAAALVLDYVKEAVAYRCYNPACPAQLAARIEHFCSRKCLDIEGIGEEAAAAIADAWQDYCRENNDGGTRSVEEMLLQLLDAPSAWLAELQWTTAAGGTMTFGGSRAQKAVASMQRAKTLPLHRWLFALGIPTIGENTSKEISRLSKNPEDMEYQCGRGGLFDILGTPHKRAANAETIAKHCVSSHLGPVSSAKLLEFVRTASANRVLHRLYDWGVESDNYNPIPAMVEPTLDKPLAGKTVVITGTLSVGRVEMQALLEGAGAKVSGSISAKTDYLVVGEKAGNKADKAAKLGVRVLTEAEVWAML